MRRPKRPSSQRQLEVLATARDQRQVCGTCGDDMGKNLGAGRECSYCRQAHIGGWLTEWLIDLDTSGTTPGDE